MGNPNSKPFTASNPQRRLKAGIFAGPNKRARLRRAEILLVEGKRHGETTKLQIYHGIIWNKSITLSLRQNPHGPLGRM